MPNAPKNKAKNTTQGRSSRQILYVLLAFIAIGAGYGIGALFPDKTLQRAAKDDAVQAWYKAQGEAPAMVQTPDPALIFPDEVLDEPQPVQRASRLVNTPQPGRKPVQPEGTIAKAPEPERPRTIIIPRGEAPPDFEDPQTPPATSTAQIPPGEQDQRELLVPPDSPGSSYEPTWLANALDVPNPGQAPVIAVVIDDMGLDRRRSGKIVELPPPLTLAYLPYARNLASQSEFARTSGHELLLHLPMQPLSDTVDPGPNHLNEGQDSPTLQRKLEWNLAQFEGYVGVNNHMGSKLTANRTAMTQVMQELKRRDLLFLDSRTSGSSVAAKVAAEVGIPHAVRNVFLDNTNDKEAVLKQLRLLERVARRHGAAVGIGHPRDGTLAALEEWVPDAWERGFVLVPLSMIVKRNQGLTG